jgi:hypothetical protein
MSRPVPCAALLACILLPSAALARPAADQRLPCADYREVRRQLAAGYGEAPLALGLRSNGDLLQVFASPEGGSWTIVSTTPQGLACILAAGRRWEGPASGSHDRAA